MGRGEPEHSLAGDGLALGGSHEVGITALVLVSFAFGIDDLAGSNGWPSLRRSVLLPPSLPDLLEPVVLQGKVLACVLVP